MKIIICLLVLGVVSLPAFAATPIRYVALGDSYTVGTGASPEQSWPSLITQYLQSKNLPIQLVANLGRNGWTTQNLIDEELPATQKLHPDIVTVLIGVNDWVRGVDAQTFGDHLYYILTELVKIVGSPKKILVVTIPDFSVMPTGKQYSAGRDIARGLAQFNQIILRESKLLGITSIDIFPLSQTMGQDPSMSAGDGIHPSAKGYAQWANAIGPAFLDRFKKSFTFSN